jgi:hypothetical protein
VDYFARSKIKFPTVLPQPSNRIRDRKFVNCVVELDGNSYLNCAFERVTLKYNGTTVLEFIGCAFVTPIVYSTDNVSVFTFLKWMYEQRMIDGPLFTGWGRDPTNRFPEPNPDPPTPITKKKKRG